MKKIRVGKKFLIITVVFWLAGFSGQSVADAIVVKPIALYQHIGVCPYKGPPEQACKMLEGETGLPYDECMLGVAMEKAEKCNEYFIQDEDILATTFSCAPNSHTVSTLEVALIDSRGLSVPADDKSRRGMSCPTGNKDGLAVLLLDECKNWSVHKPRIKPVDDSTPKKVYIPLERKSNSVTAVGRENGLQSLVLQGCPDLNLKSLAPSGNGSQVIRSTP